jgi:hypothetical protein
MQHSVLSFIFFFFGRKILSNIEMDQVNFIEVLELGRLAIIILVLF